MFGGAKKEDNDADATEGAKKDAEAGTTQDAAKADEKSSADVAKLQKLLTEAQQEAKKKGEMAAVLEKQLIAAKSELQEAKDTCEDLSEDLEDAKTDLAKEKKLRVKAEADAKAAAAAPRSGPAAGGSDEAAKERQLRETAEAKLKEQMKKMLTLQDECEDAKDDIEDLRLLLDKERKLKDAALQGAKAPTKPTPQPKAAPAKPTPVAKPKPTMAARASAPELVSAPAKELTTAVEHNGETVQVKRRTPGKINRGARSTTVHGDPRLAGAKPKRPPSWMGGGASEKCELCGKTVYLVEKLTADNKVFHKSCFKCLECKKTLSAGTYASLQGKIYCKVHFKQLFKLKGNYDEGFGTTQHKDKWNKADAPPEDDTDC